jgi:DNA polymerase-3 subunit delta
MIIFLYGSDPYRIKQAKDGYIARYKAKHPSGLNFFSFDLSETDGISQVEDSLRNSSFFQEHKLIVCKNYFSKKISADKIFEYIKKYGLQNSGDSTLMIVEDLTEKELASKHKELLNELLAKNNTVKTFEPLAGSALGDWIQKEFEIRKCRISKASAELLAEMVGNDSWALMNEIEKLTSYRKEGEVNGKDIVDLVSTKIDLNIFDLIDAIASKNRTKSLSLMYNEMKTGRDPYYILTMITYQFRNILAVKDLKERGLAEMEITRKTRLHPFVVKKSLRSPFILEQAKNIYGSLLTIDTGFKTGRLDIRDSLFSLAFIN